MMNYLLIPLAIFVCVLLWLILEFGILIPAPKGLRILLYHKISNGHIDGLTIPAENLKKHFDFIRRKGYQTLSFTELSEAVKIGKPLPKRTLILTFDDAYRNFMDFAVPLLKTYGFKASVFIPVGYMGQTNSWDNGSDAILSAGEIGELTNAGFIEFGIHSFLHRNYSELDPAGIEKDLDLCIQTLGYHNIPFVRVLAYPYGGYLKKDPYLKARMKEVFQTSRIQFALRIGNRVNRWPLRDPYEVKRIDVKGTDSFYTFKTKLTKGRRKVFS